MINYRVEIFTYSQYNLKLFAGPKKAKKLIPCKHIKICWVLIKECDILKNGHWSCVPIGLIFWDTILLCCHWSLSYPPPTTILHPQRLPKIHSLWELSKLVWQTYIFTNCCLINLVSYFLQYCVHILAWGGGSQAQEVYGRRVITHYYIYSNKSYCGWVWSSFCLVRRTGWTVKQQVHSKKDIRMKLDI